MCAMLEISPKTYYKYRNKEDSDYLITLIIMALYLQEVLELVYLVRILIVVK